jgi:DegT/DnrJ/EryC1/StrS aminotransferase family
MTHRDGCAARDHFEAARTNVEQKVERRHEWHECAVKLRIVRMHIVLPLDGDVDMSFIATATAILEAEATPVFVAVEPSTGKIHAK